MSKRLIALTPIAALVLALSSGCTQQAEPTAANPANPAKPEAIELNVSAAATLRGVLEEIAPVFEQANNVTVVYNFGASGALQKQIEGGAPADVFASASPQHVDALIEAGYVSAETTTTFASNDVVIIVPAGNPLGISAPGDLEKAAKLTTGNPDTAPHGTFSKEWLEARGLWDELADRFVFGENAAQSADYLVRGEVDAGLGFASEALGNDRLEIAFTAPADEMRPVRYVAAPLADGEGDIATAFVAYLLSDEVQQAFVDYGFKQAPRP